MLVLIVATEGSAQVIYQQSSGQATEGIASQDFEPLSDAFDCQAADNFIVPTGEVWTIDSVGIYGQYSNLNTTTLMRFWIYSDDNGEPDSVLYFEEWNEDVDENGDGDFVVSLTCPLHLSSGVYWISAQAIKNLNGNGSGQWYWTRDSTGDSVSFQWRNPLGGFGTSCYSFTPIQTCATSIQETNLAFDMYGCQGGPTVAFFPSDTHVCENATFSFDPGSPPNSVFEWEGGTTSQTVLVDTSGWYSVSVTDTVANCHTATCSEVQVIDVPTWELQDDTICDSGGVGNSVFFAVTWPHSLNIWNNTDTSNVLYSQSDSGSVVQTLIDTLHGCISSDTAHVRYYDIPFTFNTGHNVDLCKGSSVWAHPNQEFVDYTWKNSEDTSLVLTENDSLLITEEGQYSLQVLSQEGCIIKQPLFVTERPLPVVYAHSVFNPDQSFSLIATWGYENYMWSTGDTMRIISPPENGVYVVHATDTFGCVGIDSVLFSSTGLQQADMDVIRVFPSPASQEVYVQNGSDFVEVFDVSGSCMYKGRLQDEKIVVSNWPNGVYFIRTGGRRVAIPFTVHH